ncbi:MAG: serine/threonine protein kinase [Deltaproteobacteria bacterium]|nr:serine/threonine protein kinase [Deltaproteobacteria bacterium]
MDSPLPPAPLAVEAGDEAEGGGEDDGDDEYDAENDPYIGTTVGERYIVDDVLGEGGMGRVYLAHHKVIGKKMAIKILHAELAKDKDAVRRFVREAKAASSIGNPHIVDISDFGETEDGSTYFVMEYLDGYGLADMMEERGALRSALVCEIALQLCDGLAAAHHQNIVHRDLKPENVTLITQGTTDRFCKILDFGIAKVSTSQSATKLTMAGAVFGTPHYMSPEQAAGAAVDHRTDIYSLGVILYEMVAGKLPFNADNFMGILTQHMYRAPVPIRALVEAPDCAPGLEALILKCLSKKPDARYQTMEELAEDLRKYQADGVPVAVQEMMARSGSFNVPADYFKSTSPAVVPGSPLGPRKRLGPRYVALAGVAVAILVVLFVLMRDSTTTAKTTSNQPPEPTAEPRPTVAQQTAEVTAPNEIAVLVYAEPASAVAVVDGQEVKLPETFPVVNGVDFNLEIRAEGYVSQEIVLDGTQAKVRITLDKGNGKAGTKTGPRPPIRRPGKGGTGKPKGGGDYVDPWSQNK